MKKCEFCKNQLIKRYKESQKQWEARKYCNRICSAKSKSDNKEYKEKCRQRMSGNKINNGRRHKNRKLPPPMLPEVREKIRIAMSGEKGPGWKGGITPINAGIRNSARYGRWRLAVFRRDYFTCQDCGQVGKDLHADHIKPFAYYPSLRFDINNGRTLCKDCHKKTPTYAGRVFNYMTI